MSDSDDTDDLLAQPGIAVEDNSGINPLASVEIVDNLISHLSDLEARVSVIESVSSPRTGSNSFIDYRSISPMVLNELETSLDQSVQSLVSDKVQTSLNSSPQSDEYLTTPPLALNTSGVCSNTESAQDLTVLCSSDAQNYKKNLLNEIDSYLRNVNTNNSRKDSTILNMDVKKMALEKPVESIADNIIRRSSPDDRLDLPAVDRLLKEMEATHLEIETKLQMREAEYGFINQKPFSNVTHRKSFPYLEYNLQSERISHEHNSSPNSGELKKSRNLDDLTTKRDVYLVGSSRNSDSEEARKNNIGNLIPKESKLNPNVDRRRHFPSPRRRLFTDNYPNQKLTSVMSSSINNDVDSQRRSYLPNFGAGDGPQNHRDTETKLQKDTILKSQLNRNNLLSLASLWRNERDSSDDDSKKLRQKLEEEKLRRVHLENTIQELQRRVLEEQEKLAVAIKVDEGKDKAIAQITEAWKQMVNHWKDIEEERHLMSQTIIKERTAIKQSQDEMNKKVEMWEKEVSQALDLAAGYKSKCELIETELSLTKETNKDKMDEMGNKLKSFEEQLQKLENERKSLTEKLNISEEDHRQEKKLVELAHKELSSVQEALKKSEGELIITQQQRDLLSTRLREEKGRNSTLEQHKNSLEGSFEELRYKLNETEEIVKNLTTTLERTKTELRAVYQSQLEVVVKEKLEEFQNQLDHAQSAMKTEVTEARKQVQERAAAQQQALVNSHVSEMRRLETVHKEEMKAIENKLVESERRRQKLESGKKEIAHRLHGVMETQWQQALSIITSEISMKQNGDETNRRDGCFEKNPKPMDNGDILRQIRDDQQGHRNLKAQDKLSEYIEMLLNKQPGKPVDSISSSQVPDITQSDIFDNSANGETKWNQIISSRPFDDGSSDCPKSMIYLKKPPWK